MCAAAWTDVVHATTLVALYKGSHYQLLSQLLLELVHAVILLCWQLIKFLLSCRLRVDSNWDAAALRACQSCENLMWCWL